MHSEQTGLEIPWESLSAEALQGVIDEFIQREGTDYGWSETSLDKKRLDIQRQLSRRKARILYDSDSESLTLVTTEARRG